jgi:DNA-binding NtrC family response regulator
MRKAQGLTGVVKMARAGIKEPWRVMVMFEAIRDMKILLVDDDESIRDSLSMFFMSEGIHIDTLETAEEGLEALKERHYDIIITDHRLPGMDGLTFLRHIKGICPDSFKVLITAYGGYDMLITAAELGVNEYIEKPFTTKLIKNALSKLMERNPSRKAL